MGAMADGLTEDGSRDEENLEKGHDTNIPKA
jgi:hypothetical protein